MNQSSNQSINQTNHCFDTVYVVGQEVGFKSVIDFNHEMHKLKTRTGARIKTILPHMHGRGTNQSAAQGLSKTHTNAGIHNHIHARAHSFFTSHLYHQLNDWIGQFA